ncbi:MAG: sigma-70 family RNA polymerase sigma factor [Cyclobacteriaceae bacterium]
MKKVQEGDFSKMGLLFERHNRALFGFFYRITSNAAQSEDLTQNVFYRLLKYRKSYKHDGRFVYWMYTVARNVSHDQFRKKDPMYHSEDVSEQSDIRADDRNMEEKMQLNEDQILLKAAMKKLDPEKREAIVLSRFKGFKYKDIADMSGVSENAIKARVRRGLMELRNILEGKETNEL